MTALAIAFGWAMGLYDWQIAEALSISENAVRQRRRRLGLRRGAGGVPV